jgi:predicted acyl esterase
MSLYLKSGGALSRQKKGPNRQETAGAVFRPERIRSSHLGVDIPTHSDMLSGRVERIATAPLQLDYTFSPWETDAEMLGSSEFTLYVSSATSADVDLIVRTYDVAPRGEETEVTVGAIRVTGLGPGEVRRVTFRDYGDHWVFRAGHSLRLRVSNVDFPDFRPPGANDNIPSEITIHTGRSFRSRIRIPLIAK